MQKQTESYYLIHEQPDALQIYKANQQDDNQYKLQLLNTEYFSNLQEAFQHQDLQRTNTYKNILKLIQQHQQQQNCSLLLFNEQQTQQLKTSKIQYIISDLVLQLEKQLKFNNNQYVSTQFSRLQMQFNSESIDLLIIQSVLLYKESTAEIGLYTNKLTEWVAWSFPESVNLLIKNNQQQAFVKLHSVIGGNRLLLQSEKHVNKLHLQKIFLQENLALIKTTSLTSSGRDVSKDEQKQIKNLSKLILNIYKQQQKLKDYILERVSAVAPNMCKVLDPMTCAFLLQKASSLQKLALLPASTVQILGAELSFFNSLKTGSDNPKFGVIYNCQKICDSSKEIQGAIARRLSNEAALAARVDYFSQEQTVDFQVQRKIFKNQKMDTYKKQQNSEKEEQQPLFFE